MPVSINNTTLTFNDATTQTTSGVTSVSAGTGISVAGDKTPTITNTGVTSVTAGSGISVSASTGAVTISASGGGVTSLNGQTGAVTNTGFNAIGSYTAGAPTSSTYTAGSTIAGSSLRQYSGFNSNPFTSVQFNIGGIINAGQTGTWRAMANSYGYYVGCGENYWQTGSNIWVRIS